MSEKTHPGKKAAGEEAARMVKPGMAVGLGTGSTAFWAIKKIGEMVADGLQIRAVATSEASESQARELHIPIASFSEIQGLDLDIDGADEIDPQFHLIKGGGGALLREKIIAAMSRKMVVVADQSKEVERLGRFPLPVEVVPFGFPFTLQHLKKLCTSFHWRKNQTEPYLTDNGNYIVDCHFYPIKDVARLHQILNNIPGVVDNGLFVDLCDTVIIGQNDGSTMIKEK